VARTVDQTTDDILAARRDRDKQIGPTSAPDQLRLIDQATNLISETVSDTTGELFHRFYEFEDDQDVMDGLRTVLTSFIGPKMTDRELKKISGSSR